MALIRRGEWITVQMSLSFPRGAGLGGCSHRCGWVVNMSLVQSTPLPQGKLACEKWPPEPFLVSFVVCGNGHETYGSGSLGSYFSPL